MRKRNINFSWQKIEWWLKLLVLKYFILQFQFCVSFLVCFSLVCFSDKMNFVHFFSIVHLLRSVHEICLEGPTAEHAAVCMPFLKRIRTTLSTIAFLWLPVCTELPLLSFIISLEITCKIECLVIGEWNFNGNHEATCVSLIVELLFYRIHCQILFCISSEDGFWIFA